jgi:cold shock CspA family protein
MRGKIRRIVSERGFMFVRGLEGGDFWCHASQCKQLGMDFQDLVEGSEVEFDPKKVGGNDQGHNVRWPSAPDSIEDDPNLEEHF